jgi:S1-C subfamily serine protease
VIVAVEAGGPAALAGVKRGDILLQIDTVLTDTPTQLFSHLNTLAVGGQAQLTVLHGDDRRTLTVTIGERQGRPYLGLTPCGSIPMPPVFEPRSGARVTVVVPNGPAAQAGILPGDIIAGVDGQPLTPETGLAQFIGLHAPGDTIILTVQSPGQPGRDIAVTLNAHPALPGAAHLGVRYRPVPTVDAPLPGWFPWNFPTDPGGLVEQGALIEQVQPNSPAAQADLAPRDLITALDGQAIPSPQALIDAIAARQPGNTVTLAVIKAGQNSPVEIPITLGVSPSQPNQAYLGVLTGGYFRYRFQDGGPIYIPENFEQFRLPEGWYFNGNYGF